MATAEQVLAVARSQIGTVEDSRGRQKYGAFYGVDGVAWCAQFCWWVFNQAGAAALIPKTAYTPTFYQWFADRGRAGKTPRVGALVFYDWPDSVRRIQHVGIVESIPAAGQIITIEGNTTSGSAGDQSNGGGVWRRRRTTSSVVGYGYPAYSAPSPTPRPTPKTEEDDLTPDQARKLDAIFAQASKVDAIFTQLCEGERTPPADKWGWGTWGGGTDEKLTPIDYLRRNNVEVRQLHHNLRSVHEKLDAILSAVRAAGVDPDAVREAITAALGGGLDITGTAVPKQS